ncbi:MAG TPA: ricin-type beta-trefoil lectin domain protein [Candidatus Saccharimonadales bacterium]|jgi:hypothetical protein|nr:ricin-type beta-trefoil lectin domain protein [Candidatus Saccharimonadales bacterium]
MLKFKKIKPMVRARSLLLVFAALVLGAAPYIALGAKASALAGPAPVNVRAFTGGDSIALLWNPAAGDSPTSYNIYRDGVLDTTVSPVTDNHTGVTTQRWYDTAVVNGVSYSYQVSGVNAAGEESAQSSALVVTQPLLPVTVPTITVSSDVPAAYQDALNAGKTLLETWYPKIVTKYGNPSYAPTSMTLTTSTTDSSPNTDFYSNTITVPESYLDNSSSADINAMWVHEVTHIMQHGNYVGWIQEGLASYTSDFIYSNGSPAINKATAHYLDGYGNTSQFMNWITVTYNKPNFVSDLQAATSGDVVPINFFKDQTNRSLGELWQQFTGRRVGTVEPFKNGTSNMCVDLPGGDLTDGRRYQIYSCNNTQSQTGSFVPDNATSNQGFIEIAGKCMDVWHGGTANGTAVDSYQCNGTAAQKWIITANGSLKSPNSGKCLQSVANGSASGTLLEISTCTGATNQTWNVHPLNEMRSFYGSGCADVYGAGTARGTKADLYSCNDGTPSQQWSFVPYVTGSSVGAIQALGQCLNPVNSGNSLGTLLEMNSCTRGVAQKFQWQSDGTVRNISSGLCIEATGTSGAQLKLNMCSTTNTLQRWTTVDL